MSSRETPRCVKEAFKRWWHWQKDMDDPDIRIGLFIDLVKCHSHHMSLGDAERAARTLEHLKSQPRPHTRTLMKMRRQTAFAALFEFPVNPEKLKAANGPISKYLAEQYRRNGRSNT